MPKSKRRPVLVTVSVCALLGLAGSALAVENIRNESWRVPSAIGPDETLAGVQFDADLTPLDRLYGIEFFLMLQSRNSSPQLLLEYRLNGEQLPAAGTRLQIHSSFLLACDGTWMYATGGDTRIFVQGRNGMELLDTSGGGLSALAIASSGGGGLLIADEYANPGQNPMSPNGFVCARPANELPTPGENGTIGVYYDAAGTLCRGRIAPGVPGKVYILAKTAGATADGIAGAEFSFTGLPRTWRAFPVANPVLLAMGDPFGNGVVAGLPCVQPQAGVVLLYSVEVLADAAEPDAEFSIELRKPPLNQAFACPLLVACDEPAFTKYCVRAQSCVVGSSISAPIPCPDALAVTPKTWTGVKELYR